MAKIQLNMSNLKISKVDNKRRSFKNYLKGIEGIGDFFSTSLCREFGYKPNSKLDNFKTRQRFDVINFIEDNKKIQIKGDLFKKTSENIQKLISIRSYKGLRHRSGLPVRGQRTQTNGKISKKLNRSRLNSFKSK